MAGEASLLDAMKFESDSCLCVIISQLWGCLIQSSPVQLLATYSSHYSTGEVAPPASSFAPTSVSVPSSSAALSFLLFQIINLMCCLALLGLGAGNQGTRHGQVLPKSSPSSSPFNYCAAFIIKVAYDIAVDLWAWQTTWRHCVTDPVGRNGEREKEVGEVGGSRRPGTLLWSPKIVVGCF